jgi:sugar phosphate isomerase/epimerase
MGKLTRRQFAGSCVAFAAAAALPNMKFPNGARDRLAVASYPFRGSITTPGNEDRDPAQPGVALKDFAAMVRDRFDIHNIEPLSSHFPSTDAAHIAEFRKAVEQAGSHIVNIPVDIEASLYDPDASRRDAAIAEARRWVDVAAALGSPSVRIHIAGSKDAPPDDGLAAQSLRSVADFAAGRGVLVNLENDDLVSEDAFFIVKVIEKAKSANLRALPDFGNSMLKGDEDFNYKAVQAMFEHAYNISHVKDSEVYRKKVYRVDVGKTFGIAKAAGYRGYFSMEWEGESGPYEGTQRLIDESLKYL